MDIIIVRRGRKIEITGTLKVGQKEIKLTAERLLKAGTKSVGEATDAFMDALVNGADDEACFAAMEDRPDIDPEKELKEAIEAGKEELLRHAREVLHSIISLGEEARALYGNVHIESSQVLEPEEGKGICRVCHKTFELHYIAGTDDLCMEHIN